MDKLHVYLYSINIGVLILPQCSTKFVNTAFWNTLF